MSSRWVKGARNIYNNEGRYGIGYKDRVFFRFPEADLSVKNLRGLTSKANKQLTGIHGCLFLKVPTGRFSEIAHDCEEILNKDYSNVSAVKVVSLDYELDEQRGVRISRDEGLVLNPKARIPLGDPFRDVFRKNMFFNKFNRSNGST